MSDEEDHESAIRNRIRQHVAEAKRLMNESMAKSGRTLAKSSNETIIAVAIRHDGLVFTMPAPHRHHHVCHKMAEAGLPVNAQRDQGFITSTGRYVDRVEGCIIATNANQITREKTFPLYELFSEDLW